MRVELNGADYSRGMHSESLTHIRGTVICVINFVLGVRLGQLLRGIRTTKVDDLDHGSRRLTLRLIGERETAMGSKPTAGSRRGDTAATVLITRQPAHGSSKIAVKNPRFVMRVNRRARPGRAPHHRSRSPARRRV